MTVGNYLETLPTEQIVTIYNNNNIEYHGKAGYAPVYYDWVELTSTTTSPEHPDEIFINAQEQQKPEHKEENMIDFKRYSELFARIDNAFCKYGVFNVGDRCIKTTPTRVRATDSMTVFTIEFRCECGDYETDDYMEVTLGDGQGVIDNNIMLALYDLIGVIKGGEANGND